MCGVSAQRAGLLEEGAQVALSVGWTFTMLPCPTSSDAAVGSKAAGLSFPSELAQGETSGMWEWRCELMRAVYYPVTTTPAPSTALDTV